MRKHTFLAALLLCLAACTKMPAPETPQETNPAPAFADPAYAEYAGLIQFDDGEPIKEIILAESGLYVVTGFPDVNMRIMVTDRYTVSDGNSGTVYHLKGYGNLTTSTVNAADNQHTARLTFPGNSTLQLPCRIYTGPRNTFYREWKTEKTVVTINGADTFEVPGLDRTRLQEELAKRGYADPPKDSVLKYRSLSFTATGKVIHLYENGSSDTSP